MSHLWDLIQAHLDEYGVRDAAFARRMGTSAQTLNSWKNRGLKRLPERELLEAVARETRVPYEDVLDAVLIDINYKDEEVGHRGDAAPMYQAGDGPAPESAELTERVDQATHPDDLDLAAKAKPEGGSRYERDRHAMRGVGEEPQDPDDYKPA
ncbi:helix-turn-helix domain-containing protein [Cellulosimicrobium funkei]|uniref:helix-turn-helix domain-containing protein n=1 Tax=Cellulosimicrobium funkei TaxID=264251 RepID=UPI0036CA4362